MTQKDGFSSTVQLMHITGMNLDISNLLDSWDYKPGQVVVRKFVGKDGVEKLQLRVDLGILQMNASGRPDGKRPLGYPTLYDYYQARLDDYLQAHEGSDQGFSLTPEDCAKLQLEAIQYHHRYICFLQLEDYASVVRDTERNIEVFDFVDRYASSEEVSWSLQQFLPQLLMLQTRAKATKAVQEEDFPIAIREIKGGLELIRNFYLDFNRQDLQDQSMELQSLEAWLNEVQSSQPLSERERLEIALNDAVEREDYEKAAQVRDALKNLPQETSD